MSTRLGRCIIFVCLCAQLFGQSWVQLNPSGTPPAIVGTSAVAYDQPGNHLIVFDQNSVWILSNANGIGGTPDWTQLAPSGPLPPSRDVASVAYDPGSNRLIMFGGQPQSNDTWILTNANGTGGVPQWTQLMPVGLPPLRKYNSTVYDAADNRLIIFAGCAGLGCSMLNDAWVLSDANGLGGAPQWTQLNPTGGPPTPRCCLAVAYNSASNTMLIFGGNLGSTVVNDSWVLTNANGLGGIPQWIQLSLANPPLAHYNEAFGYNPNTNELIFTLGVGNQPSQGGFLDTTTWKLDAANGIGATAWTQLFPTGTPPSPRDSLEYGGAMDSTNNRLIIFGVSDVWVLILGSADTTSPVIQPTVTGTLGTNGWYTSSVTVSWSVVDPESGIASTTGCGAANLITNTLGTTLTCSATNGAGLSNSASATIKIDQTAPVITPTITGTLGLNGWYTSNVAVSWSATDPESGIASPACVSTAISTDTAGETLSCSTTNGAGLSNSQSVTIKRDATLPTITGLPVPGSCNLWPPNHKLVTVATVSGSAGISGLLPDSFLVTGASNEPPGHFAPDIVITGGLVQLRAERLGDGTGRIYTLMATVKNKAGTSASATATCTVPHDQGN